jgi:hypothetical protein
MSQKRPSDRGGHIIGGLTVLGLGVWFLLNNLGFDLPRLGSLWPIFPTLGGLWFISSFLRGQEKDAGVLIPGVGGLFVGLFFFAITLGPLEWSELRDLWPVFPLIGGIAFTATWLGSRPRDNGLLIPAAGGLGVGVVFLLLNLGAVSRDLVRQSWPVALILVGLWILLRAISPQRPPAARPDSPRTPGADPPA